MNKYEEIINIAMKEVNKNIKEDKAPNQDSKGEIKKYWKGTDIPNGYENNQPYCCAFVTWVLNEAGVNVPRFVLCAAFAKWAQNGGSSSVKALFLNKLSTPKKGDLVLYDEVKPGLYNHIGIVESDKVYTLTTIEGNTRPNSDSLEGVYKKNMGKTSISGYIRIIIGSSDEEIIEKLKNDVSTEDEFINTLKQTDSKQISVVQILCNSLLETTLVIDGILGPKTEKALRDLYQKFKKKAE